jgi:DUF4097 and DUF4098 domain-containing protein YvlB
MKPRATKSSPRRAAFAFALLAITAPATCASAQGDARVDQKVESGTKLIIRINTGTLVVSGAEAGSFSASATRGRGGESVPVLLERDSATGTLVVAPDQSRGGKDVYMEVKVPKLAVVQTVAAKSGDVQVSDVDDAIAVSTGSGNISATRVGSIDARSGSGDLVIDTVAGVTTLSTGSGNVTTTRTGALTVYCGSGDVTVNDVDGAATIEDKSGTVKVGGVHGALSVKALSGDVYASNVGAGCNLNVASGNVVVKGIGGSVRVYALSGDSHLECIKGRAEVSNASGNITLVNVFGDVEVGTASGDLSFSGPIRADGKYRMKTTSGNVTMSIQAKPPGFSVALSSYSGEMETDFPITVGDPLQRGPVNRKLVGRFGEGQAEIVLASFSGIVRLANGAQGAETNCGEKK